MKNNYRNIFLIQMSLIWIILSTSCISYKNIVYLKGDKTVGKSKFYIQEVEYHVQSGDNLFIKLSSIEPTAEQAINQETNDGASQGSNTKYRNVYLIDKEGYVKLPQFEKIKVSGLTLRAIKDTIDFRIQKFYTQASCDVRIADNYITIIGNVNNPGRYLIDFRDKISIFELIGIAGDLSFEAKRSDVKLIRKTGEETEIYSLDLTKRNILENEHYFMLPNDIVYVEPLNAVSWNQRFFPFATTLTLLLSTTTTLIVLLSYIK